MSLDAQVEAADRVSLERVCTALHPNGFWLIFGNCPVNDTLKQKRELVVGKTHIEGHIHGAELSFLLPHFCDFARSWKEIPILVVLVERKSADPVGVDERLLHAVSVVHVDVCQLVLPMYRTFRKFKSILMIPNTQSFT